MRGLYRTTTRSQVYTAYTYPPPKPSTEKEQAIAKSFEELRSRFHQEGLLGAHPCWELKPVVTVRNTSTYVSAQPYGVSTG